MVMVSELKGPIVRKRLTLFSLVVIMAMGLDLFCKALVVEYLPKGHLIPVIEGFFNLVHIRNKGVAFGLLANDHISWLFPYVNLFVLAAIIAYLIHWRPYGLLPWVSLGMICGGALGNLVDRIRYREVVDFLDFHIGGLHWPAFNVADSFVTVGSILLLFSAFGLPRGLDGKE